MRYVAHDLEFGLKEPPRAPNYEGVKLWSEYVTMRDGVRLAVDYALPANRGEDRLPALLQQTRYWREYRLRWPFSALLGAAGPVAKFFVPFGFALIRVDVRGTGASFGVWKGPWSPQEVADMEDLIEWIITQPWSNGKIGAYGNSYMGTTAELLSVCQRPAVKGVMPRFNEFDVYTDIAYPGGIPNIGFTEAWSRNNAVLDRNQLPEDLSLYQRLALGGVKPVDADRDRSLLRQAVAEHRENIQVGGMIQQMECRDDVYEPAGFSIDDISVHSFVKQIQNSAVSLDLWGSWLDAGTADGILRRFVNLSNPMRAIIGPWTHGGSKETSPYPRPEGTAPFTYKDQMYEMVQYFDRVFAGQQTDPPKKVLYYYTLGEERWKCATEFPLPGTVTQRWYFDENNTLSMQQPQGDGSDAYQVDFSATTGRQNRWFTALNGALVVYGDRTEADNRLLCYDSPPLEEEIEITGYPVVGLTVSSTAADGAFFVYLEEIDKNGKVTYLTEGELRAVHRKVSGEAPPYKMFVPYHSFKRADMEQLQPDEPALLHFGMLPISVRVPQGHRLRVAIAGADRDTFARLPAEGEVIIHLHRGAGLLSFIDLPVIKPET